MTELGKLSAPMAHGVHLQWGIRIPLRDGIRLSASLYLPNGMTGRSPCLFALTPYTVQRNHLRATYFAARGYPFFVVDARGRGNSEGTFRPFIQEARDGHDIVEWIAAQSFCNGKVAMFSGSYEGYAQWATAKELPRHLSTIAPAAAAAPGVDTAMRNNISFPYLIQWLTFVTERTSQETIFRDQEFWREKFREWYESGRPFRELDAMVGNASAAFQEWLAHPVQDAYWDDFNPTVDQLARLDLPILTVTGSYDADQPGALHYYRAHMRNASSEAAAKHYLVIGPWDHASVLAPKPEFVGLKFGPAAMLDVLKLHFDWYDWILRGGPKPEFLQGGRVAYYVMGAEKWRYADTLEGVTADCVPYYLQSRGNPTDVFTSGSLSREIPEGGPDHYVYDPSDISLAKLESEVDWESRADHRMVYASIGKQLIYHSCPFEQDTEISGFFKLTAWLAIDQPDTDFRASVYEIGLDGSAIQLTADWIRARYRESLREETLINTKAPLRYDFTRFMFVSRQIKRRHRLRLVIGPISSIYSQKNYNSGGVVSSESMADSRPVMVRLFHDELHPSALYVPVGLP